MPAKVPQNDPRYGGPIFVNPGGPGGRGTSFAAFGGRSLQFLADTTVANSSGSARETYHDIIGFDPRGVGATTPSAYCFDDDDFRLVWMLRQAEEGLPGSSNAALGRLLSLNRAMGATCNRKIASGGSILNYMSTGVVARDILELARKEAEWRRRNMTSSRLRAQPVATPDVKDVKVKFWGFSYGTHLGATFASMFPGNVGPMVLDGVLEASDFVQHHWTGSVEDTDKALQSFYDHCAAAGPVGLNSPGQGCELANNGSTSADVRERVQAILMNLFHNPQWLDSSYGPDVITYSTIKGFIFSALYAPVMAFPSLAYSLKGIEDRDHHITSALAAQLSLPYLPQSPSSAPSSSAPRRYILPNDAATAVECTDSDSFADLDTSAWQFAARELNAVSAAGGSLLASLHLRCAGWNNTAYRFPGPYGGRTATPILWVGNTADPICPIKSAVNQARRFEGSAVLRHDAVGHCSLASFSKCTAERVRTYFASGELPPVGTVCGVSEVPWGARLPGQEVEMEERDMEVSEMKSKTIELRELHHGMGMGYAMPMAGARAMEAMNRLLLTAKIQDAPDEV